MPGGGLAYDCTCFHLVGYVSLVAQRVAFLIFFLASVLLTSADAGRRSTYRDIFADFVFVCLHDAE